MLRDVVENFLGSLTEREFDGPLLAILAEQGYFDIHFIHGPYEFGKDVIAKRVSPQTGVMSQYAIQSKAGDINQSSWREVRPQIEEAEYNTRAHPHFDETLPRVAVLVTTGRLKGGAAVDAQEFRANVKSRGLADFEVWDGTTITDWLCQKPSLGVVGTAHETDLIQIVAQIQSRRTSESALERYTRSWLGSSDALADSRILRRAAIEAAILGNLLRSVHRLDLASLIGLHLLRAVWVEELRDTAEEKATTLARSPLGRAALGLFAGYAEELLDQVEPLLSDPAELSRAVIDESAMVTYPAFCCRVAELFSLLALVASEDSTSDILESRARTSVLILTQQHKGSWRPVSDREAISVLGPAIVVAQDDRSASITYLTHVAQWLLDRHDPDFAGLGLGSLDEDEETVAERLLGGALESTYIERRSSSYLATVVMDLAFVMGAEDLYEALRQNLKALRIIPCSTAAEESRAGWRRGGDDVWPQPRIEFLSWTLKEPLKQPVERDRVPAIDTILLASVVRSRHSILAVDELIRS